MLLVAHLSCGIFHVPLPLRLALVERHHQPLCVEGRQLPHFGVGPAEWSSRLFSLGGGQGNERCRERCRVEHHQAAEGVVYREGRAWVNLECIILI